jgi:phospholipase/carboxylesterase
MAPVSQLAGYDYHYEPGTDATQPVLLLLHGTGGNETDLIPLARLIAPAASLVSPRGNVLENGMPRFFRRIAEGVFDLEDLRVRTQQMGQFIREAALAHDFDTSRVVALGFSNGANIAASLMLSDPSALRHGMLIRAMVPFEPKEKPDLRTSSALLSEGQTDPIVPRQNAERLAELLRGAGARVELVWQQAGHAMVQGDVTAAQSYLGTWGPG